MARYFSGASGYVDYQDQPNVDVSGDYLSMACWYKQDVGGSGGALLAKHNNSLGGLQYVLYLDGSNFGSFQIGDGAAFEVLSFSVASVAGRWNHLAGVKRGGDLEVYFNGIRAGAASTVSVQNVATSFHMGVYSGGGNPFTGEIAYPAIWRGSLTPNDVLRLFGGANPRLVQPEALSMYARLHGYNDVVDEVSGRVGTMGGSTPPRPDPIEFLPLRTAAGPLLKKRIFVGGVGVPVAVKSN